MVDTLRAVCVNLRTVIIDMPGLHPRSWLGGTLFPLQTSVSTIIWLSPIYPFVQQSRWQGVRTLELSFVGDVAPGIIDLPSLVTLKINVPRFFLGHWNFPSLRNLWLVRRHDELGTPDWTTFLQDHAAQLELLVTQVDDMRMKARPLPASTLSQTIRLQTVFLPLSFNPQDFELDFPLPLLTRVGILLPIHSNNTTLRNTLQWWNAFRLKAAFSHVKEIVILHRNAPESFLDALKNIYGYDKRLSFHHF